MHAKIGLALLVLPTQYGDKEGGGGVEGVEGACPPPLPCYPPPPYGFSVAARKHETLHTHPINPALGGESSRGEEGPRKVGGTEGGEV